jgi:hypothetical protein
MIVVSFPPRRRYPAEVYTFGDEYIPDMPNPEQVRIYLSN